MDVLNIFTYSTPLHPFYIWIRNRSYSVPQGPVPSNLWATSKKQPRPWALGKFAITIRTYEKLKALERICLIGDDDYDFFQLSYVNKSIPKLMYVPHMNVCKEFSPNSTHAINSMLVFVMTWKRLDTQYDWSEAVSVNMQWFWQIFMVLCPG